MEKKTKYKIGVITVCYNEMPLLPYAVDYWKEYAEKVFVYDNGSDDGSVEYLKQFEPWIQVEHFDSGGLDAQTNSEIKGNKWRDMRNDYDFFVVCDLDEFHYCPDWDGQLDAMRANGNSLGVCQWWCPTLPCMPDRSRVEGHLLHEIYPFAYKFPTKVTVIDCKKCREPRFTPGNHEHRSVDLDGKLSTEFHFPNMYVLHIERGFGIEYYLKRVHEMRERRSKRQITTNRGVHYLWSDDEYITKYKDRLMSCIDVNTVISENSR